MVAAWLMCGDIPRREGVPLIRSKGKAFGRAVRDRAPPLVRRMRGLGLYGKRLMYTLFFSG